MIRLLLRLLRIYDYEPCKSCETLRQQLEIANIEKKQLTNTLLSMLNPKLVELPATELKPIIPRLGSFARQRAALEERDAAELRARESRFAAEVPKPNPDRIQELEKKLGVVENAS